MSSNGAAPELSACCSAKTLLGALAASFAFCLVLLAFFVYMRFHLVQRRRRAALLAPQRPPMRGLDAAAIALLPSFPYRRAGGATAAPAECSVCLSVVEEEEVVRQLPGCMHLFHRECADVWLQSNASCPVCRCKAEPPRAEEAAAVSSVPAVPVGWRDGRAAAAAASLSVPAEAQDAAVEIETAEWALPERLGRPAAAVGIGGLEWR